MSERKLYEDFKLDGESCASGTEELKCSGYSVCVGETGTAEELCPITSFDFYKSGDARPSGEYTYVPFVNDVSAIYSKEVLLKDQKLPLGKTHVGL